MHVKNGSKDLQNNHKSAAELGAPYLGSTLIHALITLFQTCCTCTCISAILLRGGAAVFFRLRADSQNMQSQVYFKRTH